MQLLQGYNKLKVKLMLLLHQLLKQNKVKLINHAITTRL